jgi:hypothetical protein
MLIQMLRAMGFLCLRLRDSPSARYALPTTAFSSSRTVVSKLILVEQVMEAVTEMLKSAGPCCASLEARG